MALRTRTATSIAYEIHQDLWLDEDADDAFTHAALELSSRRYPAIAALHQHLQALAPDEATELTMSELAMLYQAAQVYALALVTGTMDSPAKAANLFAADLEMPRPAHCAALEHFVQLVQTVFPDEPTLVAARCEVEALAQLL